MYNIFRAHNKRDEHQLEKMFSNIVENPLILWQLNTNADFRGIMEFSHKMKTIYNLDVNPAFYLCSCDTSPYTLKSKPFLDTSYDNGKTEITITNQFEIMEHYEHIDNPLAYCSHPLKETAYILNIIMKSEHLELFTNEILYMVHNERSVIRKFLMAKSDDFSKPEELHSRRYLTDIFPGSYSDHLDKKLSILEEKLYLDSMSFLESKSYHDSDYFSNRITFVLIGDEIACYDSSYNIIYQI